MALYFYTGFSPKLVTEEIFAVYIGIIPVKSDAKTKLADIFKDVAILDD